MHSLLQVAFPGCRAVILIDTKLSHNSNTMTYSSSHKACPGEQPLWACRHLHPSHTQNHRVCSFSVCGSEGAVQGGGGHMTWIIGTTTVVLVRQLAAAVGRYVTEAAVSRKGQTRSSNCLTMQQWAQQCLRHCPEGSPALS